MPRWLIGAFLFSPVAFSQCLQFPAGLIPFSAVSYVTAANSTGDQLVVGTLAGGLNTLAALPLPDQTNEQYCDAAIQLAPAQYYPNVYVPSIAERSGNFAAFAGLLVNPASNQPYLGGVIPPNQLTQVFAFRIAPTQAVNAAKGWTYTGSPSFPVTNHVSVLLPSGKVFIATNSKTAIYDPATGVFKNGASLLYNHSSNGSAVLLNNGRVFLLGGGGDPFAAEIYDPVTDTVTAAGKPSQGHGARNTTTILNDGRVLIVGGYTVPGYPTCTSSSGPANGGAELFDPKTGSYTSVRMAVIPDGHAAQLLTDGRALIAGGQISGSCQTTNLIQIFDPKTNSFSSAGFLAVGRSQPFATLLPDSTVLIGGGDGTGSAEVYDPVKGTASATGALPFNMPGAHSVLLGNGQVLVYGGLANANVNQDGSRSAFLYNPASGTFLLAASMANPRLESEATALLDGRVLVTGGSTGCLCAPSGGYIINPTAEIYTPTTQGLVTSQNGLTFRAAQSATAVPSQTVAVLSPTDDIPWSVSVKTYSGGNWLSATPASSESKPAGLPVTLAVSVDPTGLSPQDYYGAVTLTPTDGKHPPVTIAVVFNIVPAGTAAPLQVAPTGLVFLTAAGSSPQPQTFKANNFTSRAINFTATSTATFFTVAPLAGTITTVLAAVITVSPSAEKLTAGVYRGAVKVAFSDSTSQLVDILMVVSPKPSGSISERSATSSCTPSKLLPVVTSISSGFTAPAAWPTPVLVQVVDDCGAAINTGKVTASFTNGDAAIPLIALGNGAWSNTWTPVRTSNGATVRVDAQTPPSLTGTVQVGVQVLLNPKVPVVAPGGVLSSGDYLGSPAQGLLVSIFGSALADGALGNSSLPLPQQLGSTNVVVSGVVLPILYVSENQVNVFISYELAANTPQQLILRRGNAGSVPVPITIFENQPAILATSGNGAGQGHIYKIDATGSQILADPSSPAKAGDVLVIYEVGLGPVKPSLKSGDPAPTSFLEPISGNPAATIGSIPAIVQFAGLTPGFAGLYQMNVVVPAGVNAGDQVPVTVLVNGRASAGNVFMSVRN